MKCQILFSGENKNNISKFRLLIIFLSMLSVNEFQWFVGGVVIVDELLLVQWGRTVHSVQGVSPKNGMILL